MGRSLQTRSIRLFLIQFLIAGLVLGLSACLSSIGTISKKPAPVLEVMSNTWGANLKFDERFYQAFGERHGIKTQFVPSGGRGVYRRVLRDHLAEPDVLGIDVVWPSTLADDLIDLRPFLKSSQQKTLVSRLLADYTVHGRLVALQIYVDVGRSVLPPWLAGKVWLP